MTFSLSLLVILSSSLNNTMELPHFHSRGDIYRSSFIFHTIQILGEI